MPIQMRYALQFGAQMEAAVRFYRAVRGLPLKFPSPDWSEFATGETTLAFQPASAQQPAGTVQLGFRVPDRQAFYAEMTAKGVTFTQPPTAAGGRKLARFLDP